MQRFIIFIFLIYSVHGLSCDCDGEYSFDSEFYHCDVVLSGRVISVFDQTKDSYKVNIGINTIFKGDSISEFLVYSIPENFEVIENGDTLICMSDCDIHLSVGEEWLVYADKNSEGKYGLHYCSPTKKLTEVSKMELDFLNYQRSLITTDNAEYYNSCELDNSHLISLSVRDYTLIVDHLVMKELNTEEFEIMVKINKMGYVVQDSLSNENYLKVINKLREFEPFIPGTKAGEIVNTEHTIIVNYKNLPPPRPSSHIIDLLFIDKESKKELEKELGE